MPQEFKLDLVVAQYMETALWSTTDDNGRPLDETYYPDDIGEITRDDMRNDCREFVEANREDLIASGLGSESIGHDFWLTRNGHGTGFWDRGLNEVGERLTEAAKVYGEVNLYATSAGEIVS